VKSEASVSSTSFVRHTLSHFPIGQTGLTGGSCALTLAWDPIPAPY